MMLARWVRFETCSVNWMMLWRSPPSSPSVMLTAAILPSASAIAGGRPIDTSMGLTPMEGLVMGTRSGDVDPGIIMYLSRAAGMSVEDIDVLLNRHSGVSGLGGATDFRELHKRMDAGDDAAQLAYDVYIHRLRKYIGGYLALLGGADVITFHPEASEHVDRTLQLIKEHGCKAGLVFNPATPLSYLDYVMDKLDVILLMSVNPGFGGQSFIPQTLDKLREVRRRIDESGYDIRLEVDGGVKVNNIGEIAAAGADMFVAGSAIFDQPDYKKVIDEMRNELAKVSHG